MPQIATGNASNQVPLRAACEAKNLALCDLSMRDDSMRARSTIIIIFKIMNS